MPKGKEEKLTKPNLSHETQLLPSTSALASLPKEHLLAVIGQLALENRDKIGAKPSTNTKYVFEYLKIGAELWNIFANLDPKPFTKAYCQKASPFGGIYLIFR